MLDYTPIERELEALGLDPNDGNLAWESSTLCLDGSCTITIYLDGKHVCSAFCPTT